MPRRHCENENDLRRNLEPTSRDSKLRRKTRSGLFYGASSCIVILSREGRSLLHEDQVLSEFKKTFTVRFGFWNSFLTFSEIKAAYQIENQGYFLQFYITVL